MSEDAGTAAGTAEGADAGPGAADAPSGGAPDTDGRSAEEMLAEAAAGEDGDDLAARLKRSEAEAKRWKAVTLKAEARANANADAAKRLTEIEDAAKTEAQRLADRTAEAERRAAEAEGRYHRTLAAATYELGPDLIDLLSGSTEDEVNAGAEKLAAAINSRVAEQVAAQLTAAQAAAQNGGAANGSAPTAAGAAAAARGRRPVEAMRAGAAPADRDAPRTGGDWLRDKYADLKAR